MTLKAKLRTAVSLAAFGGLVAVTPAQALTLGTTAAGAGTTGACNSGITFAAVQTSTDGAYNYVVPPAGGEIDSWSFATNGAPAGTPYELLIARPSAGGNEQIVGTDTEAVPAALPAIATFPLANPIVVQAGDLVGVLITPTSTVKCVFSGGPLTFADILSASPLSSTAVGSAFTVSPTVTGVLNVSANLLQFEDVATTQRALSPSIPAGSEGVFALAITGGPSTVPLTVTDTVPAGLAIVSAIAGSGTCTVSGQTVSCTVPSAPDSIAIVVAGAAAGTFTNVATATGSFSDPNPANNASSAALTVTAPPTQNPAPTCHTVSLSGVPLKEAKGVVSALGCTVGKLTTKSSKSVLKGDVVSTSPGAGKTLALGTKIAIVSSSGKAKKKKHHGKR